MSALPNIPESDCPFTDTPMAFRTASSPGPFNRYRSRPCAMLRKGGRLQFMLRMRRPKWHKPFRHDSWSRFRQQLQIDRHIAKRLLNPPPPTCAPGDHNWNQVMDPEYCTTCGISFTRHIFTEAP